ncbi:MAG: hypothetical protein ACK5QX_06810 [bacterium]
MALGPWVGDDEDRHVQRAERSTPLVAHNHGQGAQASQFAQAERIGHGRQVQHPFGQLQSCTRQSVGLNGEAYAAAAAAQGSQAVRADQQDQIVRGLQQGQVAQGACLCNGAAVSFTVTS